MTIPLNRAERGAERTRTAERGATTVLDKTVRTLDGLPLALLVIALTASLIPWPSMWQVMALLVLVVLSPAVGRR